MVKYILLTVVSYLSADPSNLQKAKRFQPAAGLSLSTCQGLTDTGVESHGIPRDLQFSVLSDRLQLGAAGLYKPCMIKARFGAGGASRQQKAPAVARALEY
jgi:hypothetical protein